MNKKLIIIFSSIIALIVIGAALTVAAITVSSSERVSELELELKQLTDSEKALTINVDVLEGKILQLEGEKKELISRMLENGNLNSEEVQSLQQEIAKKNAEIAALEADISRYRTVFNIDVRVQAQLIDSIVSYIETKSPYVKVYTPIDPETATTPEEDPEAFTEEWVLISVLIEEARANVSEENPLFTPEELAASGLSEEELIEQKLYELVLSNEYVRYPNVSVYYEDLSTGYHFDYNGDKAYNSASVIKAPYVMSVLEAVSKDEQAYLDDLASRNELPEMIDTDEDGIPDKVKIEYSDPIFDLSEVVVYEKETMYKSGSGKIASMPDGTEFTYLDFVKYTIEESDNIAYGQLRSRFGYSTMISLANRAGANIAQSTMTVRGAGRLFKEIYKFIEEDEAYGQILRQSMATANHTVIIPYGVSPTKTLHKYGWDEDSYHDVAIVLYDDKPYVLAIFSDLDNGGNDVNLYLREIVKMINKLHKGFYAS